MPAHNDNREINREIFESWPIPKALTELALPMMFGQLIILVYNLADTFFIGRIRTSERVGVRSDSRCCWSICACYSVNEV